MKKNSRIVLFGALTLMLLTAACTGQEGSPTAAGTSAPGNETASPLPVGTDTTGTAPAPGAIDTTATIDTATIPAGTNTTATAGVDATQAPGVPVTGAEVVLLECQFCIQGKAHALLVLPDTATFETVADTAALSRSGPDSGCNTVDRYNGRQVVLCRSEENTSLNLNICTDGTNCTQLLVELQSCPVTDQPGVTDTPGVGLPTNTAVGDASPTPLASPTATP